MKNTGSKTKLDQAGAGAPISVQSRPLNWSSAQQQNSLGEGAKMDYMIMNGTVTEPKQHSSKVGFSL